MSMSHIPAHTYVLRKLIDNNMYTIHHCTAGNFEGRKVTRILLFCSYQQNFSAVSNVCRLGGQ